MSRYHATSTVIQDWYARRLWQPGEKAHAGPETCEASVFPMEYPPASDKVGGLRVTDDIPNISSIPASMMEYEILEGVREVPMSHFPGRRDRLDSKAGVEGSSELARDIERNGWIDPLIVGIEADAVEKGPYILEGAHRFDALAELGIGSFPALVVLDTYGSMPASNLGAPTASRIQDAERLPNETLVYRGGRFPESGLPWFTEDPVEAAKYGHVRAYYLRSDNPADVKGGFMPSLLRERGYDAARFDDPMSREGVYGGQSPQWVPFDLSQVRPAS